MTSPPCAPSMWTSSPRRTPRRWISSSPSATAPPTRIARPGPVSRSAPIGAPPTRCWPPAPTRRKASPSNRPTARSRTGSPPSPRFPSKHSTASACRPPSMRSAARRTRPAHDGLCHQRSGPDRQADPQAALGAWRADRVDQRRRGRCRNARSPAGIRHGAWPVGCRVCARCGQRHHRQHAPALHRHARSGRPAARRRRCGDRLHRRLQNRGQAGPLFRRGREKGRRLRPVTDGDAANIVYGVNHDIYDPARHRIVTAASCTTNCLAPVVKVLHEAIGIKHGSITTIHDVTNTQTIVDRPAKDLRRARSALNSLIPTTTGSATAITLIYPELTGRLNGHAVRVPLLNASITDCVFEMDRETSVAEVNALFEAAAQGPLAGVLGYETRPLVSADYTNDTRSGIVDAPSTMVVNGTQVKVYVWYDNEMGYAHRLVDVACMVGATV